MIFSMFKCKTHDIGRRHFGVFTFEHSDNHIRTALLH